MHRYTLFQKLYEAITYLSDIFILFWSGLTYFISLKILIMT